MADLYVRSYNPIWDFRSLTGLPLDDTSWAYFLENDLPYLPQAVYQTPDGIPWNSPVQLSAAGTLQNIFFDPSKVYRIEIRTNVGNLTPPSQQDALVWLIEDYVPNGGGNTPPITTATLASTNQITNPQFSLINFSSPLVVSGVTDPDPVSVAPGWDLILSGTGDYTITQVALNSDSECPTNAPYALNLNLSGWTEAYLRQRFNQSGTLWTSSNNTNRYVTASITALIEGAPQNITISLIDSEDNLLGTLVNATITANYEEYNGSALMPVSENEDIPPAAYVDYRINLPENSNISITSLQAISTTSPIALPYEQQTIERQVDQTFHYYRDSILFQPKENLLTGWDFLLNPWQFTTTTLTNLAGNGGYTADQTIVISEVADSVQVGQSIAPLGYFEVASRVSVSQGRVAVIQYIDPATVASQWDSILSSMAQLQLFTVSSTVLKVKMRLIYSTTLPTTVDPIGSWDSSGPVFTGQWTEILPVNDPEYTLTANTQNFSFNGFVLPTYTNDTQTLGIVLYTTTAMSDVASDALLIKSVSLVQNDVAILTSPLTYDETLKRCQYYYEKSYNKGVLPGTVTKVGAPIYPLRIISSDSFNTIGFNLEFMNVKRTSVPTMTFYSTQEATPGNIYTVAYLGDSQATENTYPITAYTLNTISYRNVSYIYNGTSVDVTTTINQAFLLFQYECDARLGLVP